MPWRAAPSSLMNLPIPAEATLFRPAAMLLLPALLSDQGRPAPKTGVTIRAAEVKFRSVDETVELNGSLASPEEATLAAAVEGTLVEVKVDLGDAVSKGQILARINPDEYRFRVDQAEAVLMQAKANLKRAEDLGKGGIISASAQEEARVVAARAQAECDLAKKKFADSELRAPFTGAVAKRLASTGDYLKVGQPLFQLVMRHPLKFTAEVPERFLGKVKNGSPLSLTLASLPGERFSGKVNRKAPGVNPQSRSFSIEARIDNAKGILSPGIFALGVLQVGTQTKAMVVPEGALTSFAGVTKVFVLEGSKVHERTITVERHLPDGNVVIRGELKAGDRVATSSLGRLGEGVDVVVQ